MPPTEFTSPPTLPADRSGHPATAASISIVAPSRTDGFEHIPPAPAWLMVPVGSQRGLFLNLPPGDPPTIGNVDDRGYYMDALRRATCKASLFGRTLNVQGLHPGRATLELRHGDAGLTVVISVLKKMKIPIVAHYVEHGLLRKTKTTPAVLREIVKEANRILEPQANIRLVLVKDQPLTHKTIGRNLGRVVRTADAEGGGEWDLLVRHAVAIKEKYGLNLFLVQRFERTDDDGTGSLAATKKGCCVMEDYLVGDRIDIVNAGHTLAHEVGHHRDLYHVPQYNALMHRSQPAPADRLSRREIEKMNPTAAPFTPD